MKKGNNSNGSINSPFRYAGGKFYARKLILEHIPHHSCYCEPLVGGGSIFFAKEKVKRNILNDLDEELMNVYRFIRDEPENLIRFLEGKPAKKELHHYYKNIFKPESELDRAGRWYFLNRISFSGIMNNQNCYFGYGDKFSMRPENWPRNILRTSEKLHNVELYCEDFESIIDNAPDGSFLFVDPPYFNADQDKFYTCTFNYEDHLRLRDVLRRNSNRLLFLLTYDNSNELWSLYDWAAEIHEREWNYCINRTDDQKTKVKRKGERYKGREIFIFNYKSNTQPYLWQSAK
ncbi:MAG: DNA adenine methylase [Deltaproteobacteria bacterium]|nr:DNA adenine methylase [Deltaproteobacteria bacterium]MBM4284109.1 DNA adenine methylase [Deltaproteobacteria bacterium]